MYGCPNRTSMKQCARKRFIFDMPKCLSVFVYVVLRHQLYNSMQYMLMTLPNGHVNLVSDARFVVISDLNTHCSICMTLIYVDLFSPSHFLEGATRPQFQKQFYGFRTSISRNERNHYGNTLVSIFSETTGLKQLKVHIYRIR